MVVNGKVAVITGGASGIGRETAIRYANHGASVVAGDVETTDGKETIATVQDEGGEGIFVEADVTNPEAVRELIAITIEEFGTIDVLFNNAGVGGPMDEIADWDVEDIEPVIDVNLKGVFYGMRYGIEAMLATGGGSIINTSSVGARRGLVGRSMYCATKAGVNGLTRTGAIEYANDGIRVNSVLPGTTDTPMLQQSLRKRDTERLELDAGDAMEGRGQPGDIADAALFLGSDLSRRITGVELPVDGGFLATP